MQAQRVCCGDCEALITGVLVAAYRDTDRWQKYDTKYVFLSAAKYHLDGTVEWLRNSAQRCQVCNLILEQVIKLGPQHDDERYFLYVAGRWDQKAEIHVAIGDVEQYVNSTADKRPSRTLALGQHLQPSTTAPTVTLTERPYDPPLVPVIPFFDLASSTATGAVKSWRRECDAQHSCHSKRTSFRPTRLLDLSDLDLQRITLLTSTDHVEDEYATLSYSWGETTRLKTTSLLQGQPVDPAIQVSPENLVISQSRGTTQETARPQSIPLRLFPRTLKDGIYTARRLGFRYLWIDSLCIVQGNQPDWDAESVLMTEIYGNSSLTISASTCEKTIDGFLHPVEDIGLALFNTHFRGQAVQIYIRSLADISGVESFFTSSRGWVFQERLVAPATIHYTKQGLMWECAHARHHSHLPDSISCLPWKLNFQNILNTDGVDPQKVYNAWNDWVHAFSGRVLFDKQDKFPAVAGIAKKMSDGLGTNGPCYAGIWKADMLRGLLWRRHSRLVVSLRRLNNIAPSWSWASVDGLLEGVSGPISQPVSPASSKGGVLQIISIGVEESHSLGKLKPAERFDSWRLQVSGLLQEVTLDTSMIMGERPQARRECGVIAGFINMCNVECLLDKWPNKDRFVKCYCLRVGSESLAGDRVIDHFLLLDHYEDHESTFVRIGTARCDENYDRARPIKHSGMLQDANERELVII